MKAPAAQLAQEDEERTRPWADDEYVVVNGRRLVYTLDKDYDLVVRFPGGMSMSVGTLLKQRATVRVPRRTRLDSH